MVDYGSSVFRVVAIEPGCLSKITLTSSLRGNQTGVGNSIPTQDDCASPNDESDECHKHHFRGLTETGRPSTNALRCLHWETRKGTRNGAERTKMEHQVIGE
jgi:hypothetical protein